MEKSSSVSIIMQIYINDGLYGDILDNTLMHIYNHSCRPAVALCMQCEKTIKPLSGVTNKRMITKAEMDTDEGMYRIGSFFFIMCADCRTDVQSNLGRIPSRAMQRQLIERFLAKWLGITNTEIRTNPYNYANVYVVSVENGVEILLLVANMV